MDSVVDDALRELAGTRHPRADAISQVAKKPGLYAFYGVLSDILGEHVVRV